MPPSDLERIFAALEAAGARYLVVGGVAVVLHGHLRFTADLDLAIALDRPNIEAVLSALEGLGFRPRAPVALRSFADAEQRADWVRTKSLTVFSLWSAGLPGTEVGLFVADPLPFEPAWARRSRAELGELTVSVVNLEDLIEMKRRARPQDLEDVARLDAIALDLEEPAMTERSGREQDPDVAQRRAWLRLSYAERLRWLEDAKRFARKALAAARERRPRQKRD